MPSSGNGGLKLRDTPTVERYFWQPTLALQLDFTGKDQYCDYTIKSLTKHEIQVLALNEIAVEHRRGWFMHLPSRQALTATAMGKRLPAERVPANPVDAYPAILFMDMIWSEENVSNFREDTQRARFLRASALLHPPSPCVPLYAIQSIVTDKTPVFAPACSYFALFATKSCYYLASGNDLEQALGKRKNDHQKLNSVAGLWREGGSNAVTSVMESYKVESLEAVYMAIRREVSGGAVRSSFTAGELKRDIVPRPQASAAASVGTALGERASSEAKSRRWERRNVDGHGEFREVPEGEGEV